jgi:hypothetical protein
MPVQSAQVAPLTVDDLPAQQRGWVELALIIPINRVLDLLRTLLNRGISLRTHVNAQVAERKFTPPTSDPDYTVQGDWSASRLDTPITLSGPVLGVQVLGCWTTDTAGHDVAPVSGLASPSWREVIVDKKRVLRLVYIPGLSSGIRYRVLLLLWGS